MTPTLANLTLLPSHVILNLINYTHANTHIESSAHISSSLCVCGLLPFDRNDDASRANGERLLLMLLLATVRPISGHWRKHLFAPFAPLHFAVSMCVLISF